MVRTSAITGEHSRRMLEKFVQQDRRELGDRSVPLGYLEGDGRLRTLLADFFSILPGPCG